MAKTIYELLKKTRVPTDSTQEALTELGRVRETGKIQQATGPRRGSTIEQAQQAELLAQRGEMLGEVAASDKMREEAKKQQELGIEEQRQRSRQDIAATKQKLDLTTKDILDDLERNKARYTEQQRNLILETAAATQRLANEKYMYELEDTGRRQRLESSLGMKEALNKAVFEAELAAVKDDFTFNSLLEMDDITFQKALQAFKNQTRLLTVGEQAEAAKELAKLDVATAKIIAELNVENMIKIAEAGATGEALRGLITAGGDVLTTTAGAWGEK
jgi:hypothetical protein